MAEAQGGKSIADAKRVGRAFGEVGQGTRLELRVPVHGHPPLEPVEGLG